MLTERVAGTATSLTTTDLLPVPHRPMTCQSSTISTSLDRHEEHPRLGLAAVLDHARRAESIAHNRSRWRSPSGRSAGDRRPQAPAVPFGAKLAEATACGLSPQTSRCAFRKIADHPVVLAMHRADPGRRAAALRQRAEHFREHAVVGGEAAEHRGLQAAGQAEAAEVVDGFLRQPALGGGLRGALAQRGNERAGALDEDFGAFRWRVCGTASFIKGTMPRQSCRVIGSLTPSS